MGPMQLTWQLFIKLGKLTDNCPLFIGACLSEGEQGFIELRKLIIFHCVLVHAHQKGSRALLSFKNQ